MPGNYQRYARSVHTLCGGMITAAAMALPEPAFADHARGGDGTGHIAPVIRAEPLSATWYIETIRRLLHAGRAGEAYQMARLAADHYPRSAEVRLAAAYAAVAAGRCNLARHHLVPLSDSVVTLWQSRQRDSLLAGCDGPWRQSLVIDVVTGYRPSLSDRARQAELRLQPGSRLHGVCVTLGGLCDPTGRFTVSGRRDSGIDLWVQLQLRHRYRAGTK